MQVAYVPKESARYRAGISLFLTVIYGLLGVGKPLVAERAVTAEQARQLYWSRVNLAYMALNDGDHNSFERSMDESQATQSQGRMWD